MTKQLVLVHGRSHENYDPDMLKKQWIDAWKEGLKKSGLSLPIAENQIRFPYYGNTLAGFMHGISEEEVAKIIVRGDDTSEAERDFVRAVILEVLKEKEVTDEEIQALTEKRIVERGILNWEWVQTAMKAIDRYVPGASGTSVAIATHDVYVYLTNSVARRVIDDGIRQVFKKDGENIVVGHSLGSVVTYNVLHRYGTDEGWRVPLHMTLGSPLGVTAIKKVLKTIRHPECATEWYNAMDKRDVVALYPLDTKNFAVIPAIENNKDVRNETRNHHGIAGYLSDKFVAKKLFDSMR